MIRPASGRAIKIASYTVGERALKRTRLETLLTSNRVARRLRRVALNDGQNRVKLVECSRLHSSLPYDWLEFLLAIGFLSGCCWALSADLLHCGGSDS
jgi:hypothetical protein